MRSGWRSAADETVEVEDDFRAELTPAALIGFGGVGEAVAEDDLAGVEGGLNHLGDGLRAVGEHQGHLGHGGQGAGAGVEQNFANAVAGWQCRRAGEAGPAPGRGG